MARESAGAKKRTARAAALLSLLVFALLATAAPASANDLFTLDPNATSQGHVIQNTSGDALITWTTKAGTAGGQEPVMFCKVPAGGTCTSPLTLPIPGASSSIDDVAGVFPVFGPGNTVYVVGPRYVHNDVVIWTSANGGSSFGAGVVASNGYSNKSNPSSVLLSGATFLIGADNPGLGFSQAPVAGGAGGGNFSFTSPGTDSVAGSSLGLDGGGSPVEAYWLLSTPYTVRFYRFNGPPPVTSQPSWVGPATVANGYESKLAGGASGLFLVSEDGSGSNPDTINVRKYGGTSFGAPTTLATEPSPVLFTGGAIAQSPNGRIDVAWPFNRAGDNARVMRLFSSTDGGASYSATDVAHIGDAYAIQDNAQLAVGNGGNGWLTFLENGGLKVADLNPVAPAKPPTYSGPTKTISTPVEGNLLFLLLPKNCVQSNQPFFAGVGKKARKRIRKALRAKLKVLKVTFKFDGKKIATLKKKPFRQLIDPGPLAAGSTHTVIARVKVKLTKHGHKRKKTIVLKGTINIC